MNEISVGELRVYGFPVCDLFGAAPGELSTGSYNPAGGFAITNPGTGSLKLGLEGYWKIWGIGATRGASSESEGGELPNGTNLSIQIFDAKTNETWFQHGGNDGRSMYPIVGAPIEQVAGKWGSPKLFRWPKVVPPGHELLLNIAHYGDDAPTITTPVYVCVYAQLVSSPTAVDFKPQRGKPLVIPQEFHFDEFPLDMLQSVDLDTMLRGAAPDGDILLDSLCVRYPLFSDFTEWKNSWDPRRIEPIILIQCKGSSMESGFFRSNPVPLCLASSPWGGRQFPNPWYFKVKKGDALTTTLTNQTPTDIEDDLTLSHFGLLCGEA